MEGLDRELGAGLAGWLVGLVGLVELVGLVGSFELFRRSGLFWSIGSLVSLKQAIGSLVSLKQVGMKASR